MEKGTRPFHEIVQHRLDELGENPFSMSSRSGISYDKFRNVLRTDGRRADPKFETAREIANALGLEFYVGPPRDHGPQPADADLNSLANIPVHEAFLSAGNGVENTTESVSGFLAFRKDWLRKIGLSPTNAALARARGDSMQPCIWDGDTLLIDRSKIEPPPISKAERGNRFAPVFALLDDGQAKVKRLQLLDHGVAMLISDNPDYAPQFAKTETLTIIGKVMWWGHTSKD